MIKSSQITWFRLFAEWRLIPLGEWSAIRHIRACSKAGDHQDALDLLNVAIEESSDSRLAYQYGLSSMFVDDMPRLAQSRIKRACRGSNDPNYLRVSAAVHARLGKSKEAMQLLKRSCDTRGVARYVEPEDDYVLGLIAENYGLLKVARKYYQDCAASYVPEDGQDQFARLAINRLKELGIK